MVTHAERLVIAFSRDNPWAEPLRVTGARFTPDTEVLWGGVPLETTFVSASVVRATV